MSGRKRKQKREEATLVGAMATEVQPMGRWLLKCNRQSPKAERKREGGMSTRLGIQNVMSLTLFSEGLRI